MGQRVIVIGKGHIFHFQAACNWYFDVKVECLLKQIRLFLTKVVASIKTLIIKNIAEDEYWIGFAITTNIRAGLEIIKIFISFDNYHDDYPIIIKADS